MKVELKARDKRALMGLALAACAYALVAWLILPTYDQVNFSSGAVTQKEDELRRYRRALVSSDHYAQILAQAKKSVDEGEARLIRGDNASLASVELQTLVEDAAKKMEIPLAQRNMTAARKKDDYFNEITMTISFESTPNQLSSFLADLRAVPKFVTVRNLQVSPLQAPQEAPAKGELKKTVKATMTIVAVLSSPPVAVKG